MSSAELSGVVALAERLTLATIMAAPASWAMAGHLTPEDFADPVMRELFAAAAACVEDGEEPDSIAVGSKLANLGKLEGLGGYPVLFALAEEGQGRDVGAYVWRVDAGSRFRAAVQIHQRMGEYLERAHLEDARGLVGKLGDLLAQGAPAERDPDDRLRRLSDVVDEVYSWMERRSAAPEQILGVPTGFACLDERWGGLQRCGFYVVAARPKMGKTAWAGNVAANSAMLAAPDDPGQIAYFSAEVSTFKLVLRTLANRSGIAQAQIFGGRVSHGEVAEVLAARNEIRQWGRRFWLDDSHAQSPVTIRRQLRRILRDHGALRLVIVDHMHLMHPSRQHSSEEAEAKDVANGLLGIAKEFEVPVLALAQLNRKPEERPNPFKRPVPSDLRASGAIEQNADVLAFLYRDEVYNAATEEKGICEVITSLSREGVPGTDKLRWDGRTQRFSEILVPKDEPEPAQKQRAKGTGEWTGSWHEPPPREDGWDR